MDVAAVLDDAPRSVRLAATVALAATVSWGCGIARLIGVDAAISVPLITAIGLAWATLCIVVGSSTVRRLVAPGGSLARRAVVAAAVVVAAFGRASVIAVLNIAGADVSGGNRWGPWALLGLVVGEQLGAVVAMLAVWACLTGRTTLPLPCAPGQRTSQRDRLIPVPLRVAALWLVFEVAGLVLARWILAYSHVLPMGAGPFHDTSNQGVPEVLRKLVGSILAGPYEEIGYTALIGLLLFGIGGERTRRPAAAVIVCAVVLAGVLRTLPHLYYATGDLASSTVLPIPDHLASALNQFVWCTCWAGGAMFIFIRYQRFWPIALAHSVWDLALFNGPVASGSILAIVLGGCLFVFVAKHPGNGRYRRRAAAVKRQLDRDMHRQDERVRQWLRGRISAARTTCLARSAGS